MTDKEYAQQRVSQIEQQRAAENPEYEEQRRVQLRERRKREAGKNSQRQTLDAPVFLTTEQLAARYATSRNTVAIWRARGEGPPWIKMGLRVLYRIDKVVEWENRRLQGGAPANHK